MLTCQEMGELSSLILSRPFAGSNIVKGWISSILTNSLI